MKKFIFPLIITVFFIFTLAHISLAANEIEGKLVFNKPFYELNEKLSLSIKIKNTSRDALSSIKATLTVKTPDSESEVYKHNFFARKILPKKTKEFTVKKTVSSLNLSEGVYPVELVITRNNKILTTKQTLLTVLDKVKMPLTIALVWNIHEPALFNPQGAFLKKEILPICSKGGMCRRHIEALNAHPSVNVSTNITPLFVEQLQDISDGYKLIEDGKIKNIEKDSNEAKRATEILKGYERVIKNKQVEVIPSPYSYPLLNELVNEEWGKDDASLQISLGKKIIAKTFHLSKEPKGMFSPKLILNMDSISYLSKEGIDYTLLRSSLPYFAANTSEEAGIKSIDTFKPHRVQNLEGDRLTVLFVDEEISNTLIKTEDPQEAVQLLTGCLAQIYLEDPYKQKIVAIAPCLPADETMNFDWQPSSELLENLYSLFEKPWFNPVTLEIAFALIPAPTRPIELTEPRREKSYIQTKYDENLKNTYNRLLDFEKIIEGNNPLLNKLHKQILIAEASDWRLSKTPEVANRGLAFLTNVDKTINSELKKLTIESRANLKNNEVQVTINNNADYNFKIFVSLNSKVGKEVTLCPNENMVSFTLDNPKAGQKAKVYIGDGEKNIKESDITLVEPSTIKIGFFLLIIIFALIVIVSMIVTWFFKNKRAKVKNHERMAR